MGLTRTRPIAPIALLSPLLRSLEPLYASSELLLGVGPFGLEGTDPSTERLQIDGNGPQAGPELVVSPFLLVEKPHACIFLVTPGGRKRLTRVCKPRLALPAPDAKQLREL